MSGSYPVWGWGEPADEPTPAGLADLSPVIAATLGFPVAAPERPAGAPVLPPSQLLGTLPTSLRDLAADDPVTRARAGTGRSYRDLVRGLRGIERDLPDLVFTPRDPADVAAILDWAGSRAVPVIPRGGGTSVVGGTEPRGLGPAVTVDLAGQRGLLDLDRDSRAAHLGAGTLGPEVEEALRPHELTLRFYPQSFERSTVGGWVATRAAGHFSTGPTHIDDLVEAVSAVTPAGEWTSRRLPASGAGPSPDRLLLGSEGTLGVITSAWLRVQPRPTHRWSATAAAPDFATGARAVRSLLQSGLRPATCRLVDPTEATLTGTLTTGEAALLLGLESWSGPVTGDARTVSELCADHGLRMVDAGPMSGSGAGSGAGSTSGSAWRSTFLRAPYLRESLVLLGVLVETFETAVTWDRLEPLVASVSAAVGAAVRSVCGAGTVTCRLTHTYPDGAAPYFSVFAPARRGAEVEQWDQIKSAATEAILAAGGTVTHHHAVGRDHADGYRRQRPEPFALALAGAKRAIDPSGILNPGVLLDRQGDRSPEVSP